MDAADQEVIVWDRKVPEDILKEIGTPKEVPAESVTVWIDPLDATQEYTGDFMLTFMSDFRLPLCVGESAQSWAVYTWW